MPILFRFLLLIMFILSANVSAQPYYPYPGYQQPPAETNPGLVLREGISKVLAFLEGGGASNQDKLVDFVERELAPYFDFATMARMSMGPQLRYMNSEQRREAVIRLRGMFLSALVKQLLGYEPGRVQYLPPRGNPYSNEMILSVQTFPTRGYPHRLDFYFYQGQDSWKVYDVAANGLKATTVYREHFSQSRRPPRPPAPYMAR